MNRKLSRPILLAALGLIAGSVPMVFHQGPPSAGQSLTFRRRASHQQTALDIELMPRRVDSS
jgi:hypothetical protein